jgi:hypothetical protein
MLQSIRTLMTGLIDYAGLFPPAKLEMQASAESFARARMGEHEWVLGRFICPVSRLREFSKTAAVMMPGTHATQRISRVRRCERAVAGVGDRGW